MSEPSASAETVLQEASRSDVSLVSDNKVPGTSGGSDGTCDNATHRMKQEETCIPENSGETSGCKSVPESAEVCQDGTVSRVHPPPTKRFRKGRLYSDILQQMEFYFSNASLTRDTFMQNLLEKDKYIPVEVFLKFNKIRALTSDSGDVVRALAKSQFLQVSADGTAVCRRSPFVLKEEAESCTIYVENVPRTSTETVLRRTFSSFGTIDFVSLPRHRSTGHLRGFAFVEFRTPNMAHNALQAYGALGRRIPSEHYPEYPSVRTTDVTEGHGDVTEPEELAGMDACVSPATETSCPATEPESRPAKRKLSIDSGSRDAPVKMTRFAETSDTGDQSHSRDSSWRGAASATTGDTDNSNFSEPPAGGTTTSSSGSSSSSSTTAPAGSHVTSLVTDPDPEADPGRVRRRTRRGRRARYRDPDDSELLALQIMPLSEWRRYRERYRVLQKEHMSAIKQCLRQYRQDKQGTDPPPSCPQATEPKFLPGTVVSFTLTDTERSDKELIMRLKREIPGVLYVELDRDTSTGYMRFNSAEMAAESVKLGDSTAISNQRLLQGDEEQNYWRHLLNSRQSTRSGDKPRRSRERGRDRLMRKLNQWTRHQQTQADI